MLRNEASLENGEKRLSPMVRVTEKIGSNRYKNTAKVLPLLPFSKSKI